MTLRDYLTIARRRWPIIVACALIAAAVTWVITPAQAQQAPQASSYTATATLLVSGEAENGNVPLDRVALYVTTGVIPTQAAAALNYEGDPAVLANEVKVSADQGAAAMTIAASGPDGDRVAATANAFAEATVAFFSASRPGTGKVELSVLQPATPIPDASEGGGFVIPPSRPLRTAMAALVGLLLGIALSLVLQQADSRLRTRDEVYAVLGMPILAEVPKLTAAQKRKGPITVADDPLNVYSDAYRAARTALTYTSVTPAPPVAPDYTARRAADPERRTVPTGGRLILVTSANASEGKTTSVANLAASFAETGQRVLVLDADLRSPDTHNLFDVPQGAGISDYLSDPGEVALDALVRPTSVAGVKIITAGTRLAHPASLASRMGHMLAEARELADVVLVDSAPLLAASDVFDILPVVDTVLLVVRSGKLTDVAGRRVSELLGRFQVPISGIVLVGASGRKADGYGTGYGYGSNDAPKRKKPRTPRTSRVQAPAESGPSRATRVPRERRDNVAQAADASSPATNTRADDWPFALQEDPAPEELPGRRRTRRTSSSA